MKNAKEHTSDIQTGQKQITQIFKEFVMGCDEAIIRREGKRLIFEPQKRSMSMPKEIQPLKAGSPNAEITLFGDFRI